MYIFFMEAAVFEIDRTKKEGQALYELLKSSVYAKLIRQRNSKQRRYEYSFNDLNESTQKAFADADAGHTHKSRDLDDLFEQLGI